MTTYSAWFAAGFRDLISVVPPGAPLSERTKLRPEDRGKVPGLHGHHGWYGFDWMKHEATAEDVATWEGWKANLGLRATRFPAVDIDVTDLEIRDFIQGLADRHLGPAPARTGRAPKLLLVYRLAEDQTPMVRRRLRFKGPDGRDHLVELLGHGQQYVVEGIHPVTRKPYTWDTHPAERGADALTPITHAQLDTFAQDMEDLLECIGCTYLHWEGSGDEVKDREAIVQDELKAPSLDALTDAVSRIPNDNTQFPGRTDYLRMGCAIKAAGADDPDRAMEVWEEWAARWEGNETIAGNDPIEVVSDWERMKPPFEVGWGYIRDVAQEHGFPVAAEEFGEVLEEEPVKRYAPVPRQLPGAFDPSRIERRRWVLGARFLRGAVTGGIGAPGVSKSTFSILSALAVITGRDDLTGEKVHVRGNAWVHNNEDPLDELERRIAGVCMRYGIDFDAVRPHLFYSSGADQRLVVAGKDAQGTVRRHKMVAEIEAFIRDNGIVFWACDPFVSTHDGVAENANEEVEKVIGVFREIAQATDCTVDLVHHTVKNHSGNSEARAGDMNAARGAGAFIGAVRVAYTLSSMSEDRAEALHIEAEVAARLVRLDGAKGNYAPKSWEPRWFQLESVSLRNGTEGGIDDPLLDEDGEGPADTVGVHVQFDMAAARRDAENRQTEKANERAAADLEAIVDAMPSDGCLLMDVLATLRDRWGVKDSQARERIASALPIGVEVTVGAYLFKADRTRRDERAPIELRRRARSG
ncbi:AAA family ATPase [Azospirillum brasilense]|uniref:AAA family ATPase n=1 Tax=Azospirillum argentinense TaxID=2970906 RepID=UPI00190D478A|nr:AAA family ATPase [Azospirillum argentinense]MBK3797888.1 AAA family ATPase [Azospirillum argentinense]